MGEYLRTIFAPGTLGEDWRPTSRYSVAAWIIFYAVFLIYAFTKHGDFLFIDLANLVVHEGGHLLFGWFGSTLGLWGGTLLQWLVPFLLAAYFFTQRQTTAFAFCSFFFFENWLYTATYMADARAMLLPLDAAPETGAMMVLKGAIVVPTSPRGQAQIQPKRRVLARGEAGRSGIRENSDGGGGSSELSRAPLPSIG